MSGGGSYMWRVREFAWQFDSNSPGNCSCTGGSIGFRSFGADQGPGDCLGGVCNGCVPLTYSPPGGPSSPGSPWSVSTAAFPPPTMDFRLSMPDADPPTAGDELGAEGFELNTTDTVAGGPANRHLKDKDIPGGLRKKVRLKTADGGEVMALLFQVRFKRQSGGGTAWDAVFTRYGYEITNAVSPSAPEGKIVKQATFSEDGDTWPPTVSHPIQGLYEVQLGTGSPKFFVRTRTPLKEVP